MKPPSTKGRGRGRWEGANGEEQDVVIVAAGSAYRIYLEYSIYFCQAGRSFRNVERMGFYTGNEIKPGFPRILGRRDGLVWGRETVRQGRASGTFEDRAFADAMERLLDAGEITEGQREQLWLLTPRNDPQTMVLANPISNTTRAKSGRRAAWTQRQRYASSTALANNPETTGDLERLMRGEDDRPPPDSQ